MAFIKRLRNQNWLFPPAIADLIEEDHICRFVDEIVKDAVIVMSTQETMKKMGKTGLFRERDISSASFLKKSE